MDSTFCGRTRAQIYSFSLWCANCLQAGLLKELESYMDFTFQPFVLSRRASESLLLDQLGWEQNRFAFRVNRVYKYIYFLLICVLLQAGFGVAAGAGDRVRKSRKKKNSRSLVLVNFLYKSNNTIMCFVGMDYRQYISMCIGFDSFAVVI